MRPQGQYTAEEIEAIEIGTQLKEFLITNAGQWLKARLSEGQNNLAKEALLNPAKEYTLDYYRGRAYELGALSQDIEQRVSVADELTAEEEADDQFDAFDGPQVGSGAPALGGFAR